MSSTARRPAISRPHPADSIPDRDAVVRQANPPAPAPQIQARKAAVERLTEQHNVRIRPSTKERLGKAVDKLRYETGDRSISIASITDLAIDAYLTERGC